MASPSRSSSVAIHTTVSALTFFFKLVIIFFLMGILLDRAFLYYEMGEKNKIMLKEQELIKEDYQVLIKQFEIVEQEGPPCLKLDIF